MAVHEDDVSHQLLSVREATSVDSKGRKEAQGWLPWDMGSVFKEEKYLKRSLITCFLGIESRSKVFVSVCYTNLNKTRKTGSVGFRY